MTNYKTTTNPPPAAVTVRIRRIDGGPWLPVRLLATAAGWVQVDDGNGPLWVMIEHVHPADRSPVARLRG